MKLLQKWISEAKRQFILGELKCENKSFKELEERLVKKYHVSDVPGGVN